MDCCFLGDNAALRIVLTRFRVALNQVKAFNYDTVFFRIRCDDLAFFAFLFTSDDDDRIACFNVHFTH